MAAPTAKDGTGLLKNPSPVSSPSNADAMHGGWLVAVVCLRACRLLKSLTAVDLTFDRIHDWRRRLADSEK
jgi:hypothetical protein